MNDLFLDEVIRPEPDPGSESRRSARRADREERDRSRRKRRRRSLIAVVVSLALVGGAVFAVVQLAGGLLDGLRSSDGGDVADYPGPGTGSVEVDIPGGATGSDMATILTDADVVASERAFTRAFSANPAASGIQPGTYELAQQMTAADAVEALLDPSRRVQTRVTIPEGLRADQILERLSSVTTVPVEDFEAAMEDTAATGLPEQAGGNYEGWLFPSTYAFEPGTEPVEMIATMVGTTADLLTELEVPEDQWQTVIIKASLVEKEARTEEDRRKVARAIENRLADDQKLDVDAAVAYGLGIPGTELTREDVSPDATDNPYNLYAHKGLPPGPIASPGEVSIRAVLDPAEGPWKYWVTINFDTGETRFAETYPEHRENEALLRQWQAEQGE